MHHPENNLTRFLKTCERRVFVKAYKPDRGYRDPTKYHEAYDCQLEQDILFRIFAHVLPADSPQQAESASNAGVHSNHWCRYDMAGGTAAERETDEGYHALFKVRTSSRLSLRCSSSNTD